MELHYDDQQIALVHDGVTGTSHDFIVEAEDHFKMEDSLEGTRLLKVLLLLVAAAHTFRIWWASDEPATTEITTCISLDQLVRTIEEQIRSGIDPAVRYEISENPTVCCS